MGGGFLNGASWGLLYSKHIAVCPVTGGPGKGPAPHPKQGPGPELSSVQSGRGGSCIAPGVLDAHVLGLEISSRPGTGQDPQVRI